MEVTRRTVLGALLLTPLAACTSSGPAPPPPLPDPDVALRSAAAARVAGLVVAYDAAYDAALLTDPLQAARLAPLRAEHAQHLALLSDSRPSPTTSPTPSPAPSPTAGVPQPPTDLVLAERAAAAGHVADVPLASRELAAVLATVAAAEAAHETALALP